MIAADEPSPPASSRPQPRRDVEANKPGSTSASFAALCARIDRHGLIGAESRSLTGGVPDRQGVALCDSVDLLARAAYVHKGLRVVARATSLDDLVTEVGNAVFAAEGFQIGVHDPSNRIDLPTKEVEIRVADAIPFGPNLKNPQHRFVVAVADDELLFGEVESESDASYRRHDAKPWTTSSSLGGRFARALVNLVPDATSILDPCCGAGSIVLEAASLGLDAYGVDWKPAMAGMTRENLAHFGCDATVVKTDARTHRQAADAVVTDLPYGYVLDADERTTRAILERCADNAPAGVFVASADVTLWLEAAGYVDVEVCTVNKREGFTRWIHTARRG